MAEGKQCRREGCGNQFKVGGRDGKKRSQEYCSRHCFMLDRPPLEHPGSHAPRPRKFLDTLHDEAWLRNRYSEEKLSLSAIALLVGASKQSVQAAIRKWGIETRDNIVARNAVRKPAATKALMVAAYGGECACCGEKELVFLSLDHRQGGGNADRKARGGGAKLLRHLRDAGWPTDGYRVLCMNCQFGTRFGRTCPHQSPSLAEE